jgi:hypothetical protein
VDADLVVIAHSKGAGGQLSDGSSVGVFEGQLLILLEDALVAEEEPTAHTEGGFGKTLAGGQAVVMERVGRIKLAAKLAELESLTHLELGLSKAQISGLFDVHLGRLDALG